MTGAKRFEELTNIFKQMFPEWGARVKEFKPFQRDVIVVIMNDGTSFVFLYKSIHDWSFGTKLYRAKPRRREEIENNVQKKDGDEKQHDGGHKDSE